MGSADQQFDNDVVSAIDEQFDLFIVPSLWYENNTIIMREALSHNVPVIVSHAGNRKRVTDKMPDNFMYLGLIELLFPMPA